MDQEDVRGIARTLHALCIELECVRSELSTVRAEYEGNMAVLREDYRSLEAELSAVRQGVGLRPTPSGVSEASA